jgi:folate-binding protein YgfZ
MNETTIAHPWPNRTTIALTGEDRASFLHNLCTNEIKALQPGDSCEAFVTNVQGKTVGHVLVACQQDRLLLTTVPDQAAALLAHLDRYLITEDVELHDESDATHQWLVTGPDAAAIVQRVFCIDAPQGHSVATFQNRPAMVWRMPYTASDTFAILMQRADDALLDQLCNAGAELASMDELERRRIAHRFPWFGRDLDDANLPQELGRNTAAISFTKGCYLGQETVARIDALGHVNKLLVVLRSAGPLTVGSELFAGDKQVGRVTSSVAANGGHKAAHWALGYVRREQANPASQLTSNGQQLQIVGPVDA